ncbi:MAG: aromatic acid exporter family protein [Oscillospiraceae bacterium]
MNQKYKIGLRSIKTAITIFLVLLVAVIFKRQNTFYSAIAAAVCMQPSYQKTFKLGINRLIGTIIGGTFGYLLLELSTVIPHYRDRWFIIIIPISILIVIYFCNIVQVQGAISICCIVFCSVAANSQRVVDSAFIYVLDRVIDTAIGIVLAILVDRFFFPKKSQQAREAIFND